ncbi:C-type lectin lectoxin-Phi2-like [Anomaloglossus baeobatrachus]|uniref:C-type lectin lectoxin-Phi2-like n=1 Tax=Anomaloglossus baeobatrachus TaxID=238106 RepID=UPI003F4FCAA6
MDGKSDGAGQWEKDTGVITDDVFRTVENNTIRGKFQSCFGRKRSLVFRITLLAIIFLISILLIIVVYVFNSSITKQLKTIKDQASQKPGVEELDNLKTKVTDLSESIGKMCTMCPVGWRTIGPSCYYISEETRTWDEARDECYKVNSFLAMIKDRNESDSLNTVFESSIGYWIGLRRDARDLHIWKWIDGTEVTFTNWGVNEPNYLGRDERCGEVTSRAWNDVNCGYKQRYLCEKNRLC